LQNEYLVNTNWVVLFFTFIYFSCGIGSILGCLQAVIGVHGQAAYFLSTIRIQP
jgi:hypothetical protein